MGNEYLSKLINPDTFFVMDAMGNKFYFNPKEMASFVIKFDLKVIDYLEELPV